MNVLVAAYGMSRWACGHGAPFPLVTDRMVKYIANSAEKNMSSDESHTIVPTLTRLGRLARALGAVSVAVATRAIIAAPTARMTQTPPVAENPRLRKDEAPSETGGTDDRPVRSARTRGL